MKLNMKITLILLLGTILSAMVSSCDFSKAKIGEVRLMYGSNEDGRIAYEIEAFTGIENGSLEAEPGQAISFKYQAILEKGSLVIEWQDPSGDVVWQRDLSMSELGDERIVVDKPGKYTIFIQGKGAGGNFDVSWQVD